MKVIIALMLAIGSVAASGSGPYLPSGWRPQGPAFYLPTENQAKPADSPVTVTIFQENEASGSDSLREYGPPKLQEVISFGNQGLPDVVTDQIFQTIDVSSNQETNVEQNLVTDAITEEKSIVAENVADTESNVVEEKKVIPDSEAEKVIFTQSPEEQTVVVTETVEDRAITQIASNEDIESTPSTMVDENADDIVSGPEFEGRSLGIIIQSDLEETTQISTDAAESSQVTQQEVETTEKVLELNQGNAEIKISTESNAETEQSEVSTLPTVGESNVVVVKAENKINIETKSEEKSEQLNNAKEELIRTDLKELENVAVEGVNNIAEALVKLENEVSAEKVVSEVKAIQEVSGSVEQAPEGFLEYGPPGFREYGPPKGDEFLKDITGASSVVTNELRKRRFSPKFSPTKKNH